MKPVGSPASIMCVEPGVHRPAAIDQLDVQEAVQIIDPAGGNEMAAEVSAAVPVVGLAQDGIGQTGQAVVEASPQGEVTVGDRLVRTGHRGPQLSTERVLPADVSSGRWPRRNSTMLA